MPVELLGKLTLEAERSGMSLNAYILMLVRLGRAQLKGQARSDPQIQRQNA